ncbi:hypothetical protein Micbo1qcDRAFT_6889 [Microdochium bolleyi]|uniref:Mid2 domain-containing protein n=1 Tax=Microdochium bolleyi TaxID=196109 RepID=A0A136JJG5_9PEZI|nr:hypothetical protein Micbo1qcDRAFT_6889 [Microdochium bolleyi]
MAGLFDGLLPGLGGGNNNDGGILGPLLPSSNGDNQTPRPSTTANVGSPPPPLTLTAPQSTRTQQATSATATATTRPTTLQTSVQPVPTTTRPTTTNLPTTMMTIPSPAPTTQDTPADISTTPPPAAVPTTSDPVTQTTPAPQSSGTLAPVTDNRGSSQDTIASLPKTTFIGIASGVGALIVLLIVVFMVRRTLRSRREGNRQILDRLDLTIGTSEAPVGSSAKPAMTRSMEDLNRSWNAGLEQYHQPPRAQVNAKGMGYAM